MKPHETLLRFWSETSQRLDDRPASQAEVTALESRFGVRLPEDFRDYLLHALPRSGLEMDRNMTTWWSVRRMAAEQERYGLDGGADKYLVFSDFLIDSHAWAIACGDTERRGRIVVLESAGERVVAESFAVFVDLNIADDTSLC